MTLETTSRVPCWLLICVTEGSVELPDLDRFQVASVARCEDLQLVAAPCASPDEITRPSRDTLRAYHRVIEHCFDETTTLPLRFGSIASSRARAEEMLLDGTPGFQAFMARARGCVEMGIRVDAKRRPREQLVRKPLQAGSGAEYLAARSAQLDTNSPRVPAELKNILRGTFTDASATRTESPVGEFDGPSVSYNFLCKRNRLDTFEDRVARWATSRKRVTVSGPWPPFSFTVPKP